MHEIRLEDATIKFQGEWRSAEELTEMVKRKLDDGDLKIAEAAEALEALKTALENAHTLEERVVVTREVYDKLVDMGEGDEKAGVRQAVKAYIENDGVAPAPEVPGDESETSRSVIKCTHCKALIEVPSDKRPIVFDCPVCSTSCRLTL